MSGTASAYGVRRQARRGSRSRRLSATGGWALFALSIVGAGSAFAQQANTTPAGTPGGVNAPSVAPGVSTTSLSLSIDGSYSTNVSGTSVAQAQKLGLHVSDFYASPLMTFVLARPFGYDTAYLTGDLGYTAYARNRVLDRSRSGLTGGAIGRLSLCNGSANGSWNRSQADLLYYLPAAGVSARSLASDVVQNISGTVSATCGSQVGFAPTLSFNPFRITHSELPGLNANGVGGNAGIAYQNPALGVLSLTGQYTSVQYPDRTFPGLPSTRLEYDVAGGGLSYTRLIGTRLSGVLAANYVTTSTNFAGSHGYSGFSGNADLQYLVTPSLTAHVSAARLVAPSTLIYYSYEVDQKFTVDLKYKLAGRIDVQLGGYHDQQRFYDPVLAIFSLPTNETIEAVTGAVRYQAPRLLAFGLNIAEQHRSIDLSGLSYTATVVSLTASSTF